VPLPKPTVSTHAHAHVARPLTIAGAPTVRGQDHAAHIGMAPPVAEDHAALGRRPRPVRSEDGGGDGKPDMRRRFWISLALGIPVVLYSPLATNVFGLRLPAPFGIPHDWIMLAFSTPVALWTSSVFHVGAYASLRSRVLNMSVLVSLGILVSYLFSVGLTVFAPGQETFYEAAVMLSVFLLFGHWIEMTARRGSSDAVRTLLDHTPQRAVVERDGQAIELPVAEVLVGDVVVLRPGDKTPVDGVVIDGQSTLDESMITGESVPVAKGPGEEVIAGTINGSGSLRFRATKVGADTALAQIVRLVETAQNSKAPAASRSGGALSGAGRRRVNLLTFVVWFAVLRAPLLLADLPA
jgi:Cu2+-exporting ATPase